MANTGHKALYTNMFKSSTMLLILLYIHIYILLYKKLFINEYGWIKMQK